jgi:hypothetical protein
MASGVSTSNVDGFLDMGVTDFLVATSLIREVFGEFDLLDPREVASLASMIHK